MLYRQAYSPVSLNQQVPGLGWGTLADDRHDPEAAERLLQEVMRLYLDVTGKRFSMLGLERHSAISRQTLGNWLEKGIMPPQDGMKRLATALEVSPTDLWVRWLDLGNRDPLDRIADELAGIRRALAPDEEDEAQELAEAAGQAIRALEAAEASEAPRAPHDSAGSGRSGGGGLGPQ